METEQGLWEKAREPVLAEVGVAADRVVDKAGWGGGVRGPDQAVNAYALPAAPPCPISRETPASNRNAPSAGAR